VAKPLFAIRDEGTGFDRSVLTKANIERARGGGIFIIPAFLDKVRYNEVGNAVVLVKRHPYFSGNAG
jgi:anti-sigma regulatory factor (Ser/Thr protein kinase)